METVRGLVRPTVTWGLAAAFVAALFMGLSGLSTMDDALKVAGVIGGPMGITVGFWFNDRTQPPKENADAGSH